MATLTLTFMQLFGTYMYPTSSNILYFLQGIEGGPCLLNVKAIKRRVSHVYYTFL